MTKSVFLRCAPERAFFLFTQQAGLWWPADRRHTDDDASAIVMEPDGRFFERAANGTEVDLGLVRLYEPSRRLVLDWYPGTGRAQPTTVEITFESNGDGTLVTVRHEAGAAGTETFARNVAGYAGSWDLVLSALAKAASDCA